MPTSTGMANTRISVRMLGRFQSEASLPLLPLAPPLAVMIARVMNDLWVVVVVMSARSAAAATLWLWLLGLLLEGHARRCHCCWCCWCWVRVISPRRWERRLGWNAARGWWLLVLQLWELVGRFQ